MSGDWYETPHATRITLVDTDDSGPQQFSHATGLLGQDVGQMARLQHFGESSNPPAGSEGWALAMGGGASRMVALGFEHPQYRPTNTPLGGKVLYDSGGNAIRLFGPAGVTMAFDGNSWTVSCKGTTITSTGDHVLIQAPGKQVRLGDTGPWLAVETVSGPSSKVFAAL